jgi:hypothetical protein
VCGADGQQHCRCCSSWRDGQLQSAWAVLPAAAGMPATGVTAGQVLEQLIQLVRLKMLLLLLLTPQLTWHLHPCLR